MTKVTPIAGERVEAREPELPTRGFIFDGEASLAAPRELVHGVLGFDGVAFLGGQSGAGKTFVAIDAAIALASGDASFFGRSVRERVGVVILAAEGAGTMAHRIEAARRARNAPEALPIAWTGEVLNLADLKSIPETVERVRAVGARFLADNGVRLGVVIVDTVAAAFHLKDENDNAEGARVVNHLRQMGDALGCLMVPIHHYGKSADTGLRGASAFRAGADVVISVLADRNEATGEVTRRRLALAKSRTRDEGPIGDFDLKFEALGTDDFGEDFGACYVVPTDTKSAAAPRSKLSERQRLALDALTDVILDRGNPAPAAFDLPEGLRVVEVDLWREEMFRRGVLDRDAASPREDFRRVKLGLLGKRAAAERDGFIWTVRT